MPGGGEAERDLWVVVTPMLFMALWSALCAALVHHGCSDINAVISEPRPGTPRAGYCDAIGAATPWLTLTIVPTAVIGIVAWVSRRHPRQILIATFALSLLLIANAVVANSLTYSVPGP